MRSHRARLLGQSICLGLFLAIVGAICVGQQAAASAVDPVESFALQLINSSSEQRAELLAEHRDLLTVPLRKELVRQGNILLVEGKYAPAFEIYRLAEKIAEQIGDKDGLAATSLNIGSVYYVQNKFDLALENYRKAQQLFSELGNRSEAARSQLGLALTFQGQRKLTEALASFEQALKEYETLNDQNGIAETLAGIGSIQYDQGNYVAASRTLLRLSNLRESVENLTRIASAFYMQKDYAQALTYYQRALDASRQKNSVEALSAQIGIANCYYNQRNYDQALEFYNRSLTLSERLNDKSGVATQLQNIGNVYRARGDYGSALQSYLKSLSAAAAAQTKVTIPTTLGSIGLVRSLQGDNAEALEYFTRSLHEFQTNGDQQGMARLYSYIGNARYLQGEFDLALSAYQQSLELHKATADNVNQAHVILGIGTVYLGQEKYDLAVQNYQQALQIYETLGRKADVATALTKLAATYRLQGEYAKGLDFASKAVNLVQGAELPVVHSLSLTEVGRLQQGLKQQRQALTAFNEAIQIQQSMFSDAGAETEGAAVLPYLGAMEVLFEQEDTMGALARAEDAKAQTLRELLRRGNFNVTREMTAAEQKEETKLLADVSSLMLQLNGGEESGAAEATRARQLRDRLTAARAAYESFRKALYAKHPQLGLYRGELPPLNAERMRPLIQSDTALVEYTVSQDKVFLFVATTQENANSASAARTRSPRDNKAVLTVRGYLLPVKPAELADRAAQFLRLLAGKDQAFAQSSRELYDLLLKPAEQQLLPKSNLIIVPDGVLWDVPFAALQAADSQYLIDQKTLSYAISLSALSEMRKKEAGRVSSRPAPATVLALASPVVASEVLERLKIAYKGIPLGPAEGGPAEIDQLRSVYATSASHFYTGASATTEKVKAEASTHRFLHFATHSFLDESVPLYSFIVLSPDPGLSDDGLLRLREITNLNSKARVVVLPASSLAQAGSHYGNALIAMSWTWFVAGTPAVILSRWEVAAPSVTEFSSRLHSKLRSQGGVRNRNNQAELFRESVLTLRGARDESPYDWSGFMLLGEPW